jgi:ethanolaminephosphotransferase
MSKTATSYGIESMYNGMALASFAIFCVTTALVLLRERFSGPTFFIVSLALANGMMMFASSFVEEEQHFWYWASSALVAGLYWRR